MKFQSVIFAFKKRADLKPLILFHKLCVSKKKKSLSVWAVFQHSSVNSV